MRTPARIRPALISAALALAASWTPFADPAARAAEPDWSRAETVTVVMSEYSFSPDHLVFRRGVAYRLHIENHGKELHEFSAPAFLKAVTVRNPDVLNRDRTEVFLSPRESKDLYFVSERPGAYGLACSDHDWEGMTGEITIE